MATMYTIGSVTVCGQALAILVTGLILSVVMIAVKPSLLMLTLSSISFLIVCFYAYQVNCMIVGKCEVLAWILSIFWVLNFGLMAIAVGLTGKIPGRQLQRLQAIESLPKKALKSLSKRK